MRKFYIILAATLFLTACGGGSSSGGDDSDTTTAHAKNLGRWSSNCLVSDDGTSLGITLNFVKNDNSEELFVSQSYFGTSDCSDFREAFFGFAGDITYPGETITSTCIADNFDLNITNATEDNDNPNENIVTGSDLSVLLLKYNLPEIIYSITCQYDDNLYVGEETATYDGTSNSRRPITEAIIMPFTQVDDSAARGTLTSINSRYEFYEK